MKNICLIVSLVIMCVGGSVNAATCLVPKGCEIISSEFSTGGGDKVSYIMEVDCKQPGGMITKYTHWRISAGSLFGVGRFTMPRKITFSQHSKDELVCSY